MHSPIKYYGGKSYMTDIIINQFPSDFEIYVEGFGGGASILFKKEPSPLEVYNDLGENVYSLFKVLSDKGMFQRLKEKLDLTFYSEELREEFKNDLRNKIDLEERAYKYLYVNRTSFNGVGGFSTTLLARRNMSKSCSDFLSMIDKLPEVHNRLSSVIIEHKDIMELIEKYDRPNVFMYLDPPYVHSTRSSGQTYEVEMTDDQHENLCKRLLTFKGKVLISGYDNDIYKILDEKFEKVSFKAPNTTSGATECLWRNYAINNDNG